MLTLRQILPVHVGGMDGGIDEVASVGRDDVGETLSIGSYGWGDEGEELSSTQNIARYVWHVEIA